MKFSSIIPFLFTLILLFSCSEKSIDQSTTDSFSIEYEKFTLDNGLEVILHVDKNVTLNKEWKNLPKRNFN